jgi:signal peptidase I
MNSAPSNGRMPWLAVVFSLLCPGLGHVYCGQIAVGLALLLASLLFTPLVVLITWAGPSTGLLVTLLVLQLAMLGIYAYAVVDSYRAARRLRHSYERRDCNQPILYALLIIVGVVYPVGSTALLKAQVVEAFYIPTASMTPGIFQGDRVLVNKLAYGSHGPRRGDVVVFRAPGQRQQYYVKRVVALAGDTVAVRRNDVYINGIKLERETGAALVGGRDSVKGNVYYETNGGRRYTIVLVAVSEPIADYPKTAVPEDHVFVLGDNRDLSRDSRAFGPVPLGDVPGPVQYIYYPAKTWRRFGPM